MTELVNGWSYSRGASGAVTAVDPQGRSHNFPNWNAFWNATGAVARPTSDPISVSTSSNNTSLRSLGTGIVDAKWSPTTIGLIIAAAIFVALITGGFAIPFLLWGALCYGVGQYAKKEKGRDPVLWGVLAGVLITPLGAFIILACLPKRELPAPPPPPEAPGLWQWHGGK
jgi:hypothetical protein